MSRGDEWKERTYGGLSPRLQGALVVWGGAGASFVFGAGAVKLDAHGQWEEEGRDVGVVVDVARAFEP